MPRFDTMPCPTCGSLTEAHIEGQVDAWTGQRQRPVVSALAALTAFGAGLAILIAAIGDSHTRQFPGLFWFYAVGAMMFALPGLYVTLRYVLNPRASSAKYHCRNCDHSWSAWRAVNFQPADCRYCGEPVALKRPLNVNAKSGNPIGMDRQLVIGGVLLFFAGLFLLAYLQGVLEPGGLTLLIQIEVGCLAATSYALWEYFKARRATLHRSHCAACGQTWSALEIPPTDPDATQ